MSTFFCSSKLNYTFSNEDGNVDRELLPMHASHVLIVAGSGSRLCHFLEKKPKKMTLIDISREQLWLCDLRLELIRFASYTEYLAFWGIGDTVFTPKERKDIFEKLGIQEEAKKFLRKVFEENSWESILYTGQWEKTFAKSAKWVRRVLGNQCINTLLGFTNINQQLTYLKNGFPRSRWNLLLRAFSSATFFSSAMYGKEFPKMNVSENYFEFFKDAFERSFRLCPVRENFFLQIVLLGKVAHSEALPPEFRPQVFDAAKRALKECEIALVQSELVPWAAQFPNEFDVIYCSDVPSYFKGPLARQWLVSLRPSLKNNGKLIARYYRNVPGPADAGGYLNLNHLYRDLYSKEQTQVYYFDVLQKVETTHG